MGKRSRDVFVGLVVLLALVVRLHHLDFESLFMDELRQVSYYPHSFGQIIDDAASQQQMPLDYWVGRVFYLFSNSDFVLRLPAALSGTGAVLVLMLIVGRASSWTIAIFAGLLFALSPFHLYYSQDARPYAIAIFFFLWMVDSLWRALDQETISRNRYLVLQVATTGYLYSRTLSPLVSTFALTLVLLGWLLLSCRQAGWKLGGIRARLAMAIGVFGSSFLVSTPVMRVVLEKVAPHAHQPAHFGMDTIRAGIDKFSLAPLWQAHLVQAEPLGYFYLAALVLFPFLLWKTHTSERQPMLFVLGSLLPVATLMHTFIFQAKAGHPIRPPYFVYLLPLVLILCSCAAHLVLQRFKSDKARYGMLGIAVVLVVLSAVSIWTTKGVRKKANWRELVAYIENEVPVPQNIVFFETITRHPHFAPSFYGFDRYYQGDLNRRMRFSYPLEFAVPEAEALTGSTMNPTVILFYYRNYRATPHSKYPVHGTHNGHPVPDTSAIRNDPELNVASFTCFEVVQMRESTENSARDLLRMMEILIGHLPEDSGVIHLHLVAASLKRALKEPDWRIHMELAEELLPPNLKLEHIVFPDILQEVDALRAR